MQSSSRGQHWAMPPPRAQAPWAWMHTGLTSMPIEAKNMPPKTRLNGSMDVADLLISGIHVTCANPSACAHNVIRPRQR